MYLCIRFLAYGGAIKTFFYTLLDILFLCTSIERGLGGRSDVLAHEFGHAIDIAKDPQKFYLETKTNPEHNCQDPANRNHPQSKTAMDWQERFNKKYKEYQKK